MSASVRDAERHYQDILVKLEALTALRGELIATLVDLNTVVIESYIIALYNLSLK